MPGTPELEAFSMPPLAVNTSPMTFDELENNSRLIVDVAGHVVVDHAGVAVAPDWSICRAVAVPAKIWSCVVFDQTMPPLLAVRLALVPPKLSANGVVRATTPAALTVIGAVPVIAPPPEDVTQVGHVRAPEEAPSTSGEVALTAKVPAAAGRLMVTVPSAPATGCTVTMPDVALPKPREPRVPEAPRTGVLVKAGAAPARTPPDNPVIEACPVTALIASGAAAVPTSVPAEVGRKLTADPAAG